ncbi:MAG: hypothetical protein JRI23_26750, partial [Deltaproteobacteria bacterium]|nr:hypothetical protein [Deltaproteobacteria bacterium]MBW2535649.1 hypothetical protein [Deltaproteobacteria bacterium]
AGYPAAPVPPVAGAVPAPAESVPIALTAHPAQPSEPAAIVSEPSAAEAGVPQLLAEASEEAQRGRKPQAYGKYREVLDLEPANAEALSWVEDFLRQRRKFADLRDVLLAASRVSTVSEETRKAQLRDVAGLCESKLRDFETAITAWKQICQLDRGDDAAREQLCGLLEKQKRWDELAPLLEQQAMNESDVETKISMEKKIAQLHEQRRKDPAAAAEAWIRIAELAPGDDSSIMTAVKLYEKGEDFDAAAGVIADWLPQLDDVEQKASMLERLAELRVKLGDPGGAGDAYAEAAELGQKDTTYEQASDCYRQAERWADVAHVTEQRAMLHDGETKAGFLAEAGQALVESGNAAAALVLFEQASELDPASDAHAERVEAQYLAEARQVDLATFLARRADALESDEDKRVSLRHRAAQIQFSVGDEEGACETLRRVLEDREDREALEQLYQAAERRVDHMDAVDLLQRLVKISEGDEKLGYALREAQIVVEGLGELGLAVDRYEQILQDIQPDNRTALRAIADLERQRDNPGPAASALERELKLAQAEERIEIAGQLAELYEGPVDDPKAAVRVLDIIHEADPEDFDAIARLQALCEKLEDWPRVAELLKQLIEVEGDEEEASEMTRQLAQLYRDKLDKGDEALGALEGLADQGDVPCQHAYVDFGIELGWKGLVAQKLVQWNQGVAGSSRAEALRQAFDLFVEAERDADARAVAVELAESSDLDAPMASRLEEIATKLKDLEAMGVAHDLLVADLSGVDRATELVRQAELMAAAGADATDAIAHGEQGLSGIGPEDADFLIEKLAGLTGVAEDVLDLYERQVARCRQPQERVNALARAAQVAAERGSLDRARDFFNAALSGGVQEDTIAALESAARMGAEGEQGRALLQTLAEALAGGGQGSRDGGRTRSSLLRRAAVLAHRDLDDIDRAFAWLADSIIAHVDEAALDALAQLGSDVGDMSRVEGALNRALDEVFDGPLVRQLLRRRYAVRRDHLNDLAGATSDLKRLHDLSPSDQKLTEELSAMLTQQQDHRGMIELYEDQILRGREPTARAELARKVARLWEEHIGDVREAADAWRRVLRMRSGDEEATAGLERAKTRKLKRAPKRSGPPPAMSAPPPARPSEETSAAAAEPPQESPPPAAEAPEEPQPADFADTAVSATDEQAGDFGDTAVSATEAAAPEASPPVPAAASQPPPAEASP